MARPGPSTAGEAQDVPQARIQIVHPRLAAFSRPIKTEAEQARHQNGALRLHRTGIELKRP